MRGARVIVGALCLLGAGCAVTRAPATAPDGGSAQQLMSDGCYDCLLDAQALDASVTRGTGVRAARLRRFESQMLIVLRQKELAIDARAALAELESLAGEVADQIDAEAYINAVTAIPPDTVGTPREALTSVQGRDRQRIATAALGAADGRRVSRLTADYLSLAIECSFQQDGARAPNPPAAAPQPGDVPVMAPLLQYRHAICRNPIDGATLVRVRERVPRFAEAAVFIGRAAFATLLTSDGSAIREALDIAYARFPNSPSVTLHLGNLTQAHGDCRSAADFFSQTLALADAHEAARLGRAICRTYLADQSGAIADATNLIDRRAPNQGEAHYWRAWNLRASGRMDEARSDAERGKSLLFNTRMLTLAGMIEHDQGDYELAATDLRQAISVDPQNCNARWYLGLVGYRTSAWLSSAAEFLAAADCYDASAARSERARAVTAARADLSQAYRAHQDAGFAAAIAEDRSQGSAAALNAALNFARGGERENAFRLMDRAAADPARQPGVEELRRALMARPDP